jgi:hypothetical protein
MTTEHPQFTVFTQRFFHFSLAIFAGSDVSTGFRVERHIQLVGISIQQPLWVGGLTRLGRKRGLKPGCGSRAIYKVKAIWRK